MFDDPVNSRFLTPEEIAQASLLLLREQITQPLNVDPFLRLCAQKPGNRVMIRSVFGEAIPVDLTNFEDFNFAITSNDLTKPIADFSAEFLVPAAVTFAERIDQAMVDAEPGACFASAPLESFERAINTLGGTAVETLDGISLRVHIDYEYHQASLVTSLGMLFGVAKADAAVKAA